MAFEMQSKSFRIRLDIGIERRDNNPSSSPFDVAASASTNRDDTRILPEFEITYNDETTFANVLTDDIIEKQLLGGHLLEFLEAQTNGQREEVYVLMYSKKVATLVQPYWSGHCSLAGKSRDGKKRQVLLHLHSFDDSASTKVIKPKKSVSSFIKRYTRKKKNDISKPVIVSPETSTKNKFSTVAVDKLAARLECDTDTSHDKGIKQERPVTSGNNDNICINMKLTATICDGYIYKPKHVNILLCEEHWRQRNKLLSCNLLCTPKQSTSLVNKVKQTEQHHQSLLKSFLIHDFLGKNQLLMACAFLVPTTLILRGLDTIDGIQISVDKPSYCQSRCLNLRRPAVLRQYFGLDLDTPDLPPTGREDVVWRSSYGVGSGAKSVGIHNRFSTTREMTFAMKVIADEVYQYLKARFADDYRVIHPFNHVTVLFYYQKIDGKANNKSMLGYHTDNVFSHDGVFLQDSNSQMENTFTALLTLGDDRKLNFRRQRLEVSDKTKKRKWTNDTDSESFTMRHNSLFLLDAHDEKPTSTSSPECPTQQGPTYRWQHGDVRFPYKYKISAALALRTVTSKERVYKDSGKLFLEQPPLPQMLPQTHDSVAGNLAEPEIDFLLDSFCREKSMAADETLKERWLSVCSRHFNYHRGEVTFAST